MKKIILLLFILNFLFIMDSSAELSPDTEQKLFYFFDKKRDSKYINDNYGWFNYGNKYDNNINFSILVKGGLEIVADNSKNVKNLKDKNIIPLVSIKNGETDIGGVLLLVSSREVSISDFTEYVLEKIFKTIPVADYSKTKNDNIIDVFSINKNKNLFIVSRTIKNGQNYYFYYFINSSLKDYLINKNDFGIMLNSFFVKNISKSKFTFDLKNYNYNHPFVYSFYYPKKWLLKNDYADGDKNILLEITNNDNQIFYVGSADLKTSIKTIIDDIFNSINNNSSHLKIKRINNDNLLINDNDAVFNLLLVNDKDNSIAKLYGKIIQIKNKRIFVFLINNLKEQDYFLYYENKRVLDIILDTFTIKY